MKSHFILFICAAMYGISGYAKSETMVIGNRPDGTEVEAEKHFFGKRIENFRKVPGKPHLCLNFNEVVPPVKQELGLYDVLRHRMVWITDIDFAKDCYIPTSQGVVMQSSKNTFMLDDEGNIAWESKKFLPIYVDEASGIVMGYPSYKSNELKSVSMRDGSDLWSTTLPHKGGWSEVCSTADGRLLISADKICLLNPTTGEAQMVAVDNYHSTAKQSLLVSLGATLGGILGGVLLGAITSFNPSYSTIYMPGDVSTLCSLNSNFCFHRDRFYYADRRCLRCMDNQFNIIWEKDLPKKASMSFLYVDADTLFFENTGWGKCPDGRMSRDTRSYNMKYDPATGNELSEKGQFVEEENFVQCFLKVDEENCFEPQMMSADQMEKQNKRPIYQIDKPLGTSLLSIFSGTDYWIIDREGQVKLHFTQPLLQTETVGNILVGLTQQNVIFQFDYSSL